MNDQSSASSSNPPHQEDDDVMMEYTSQPEHHYYYATSPSQQRQQQQQQAQRMQQERDWFQQRSQNSNARRREAAERAKIISVQRHLATLASIDFDSDRSQHVTEQFEKNKRELHLMNVEAQRVASERVAAVKTQRVEYENKRHRELTMRAQQASSNHSAAMQLRAQTVAQRREEAQARAKQKQESVRSQRNLYRLNRAEIEKARQVERGDDFDEYGHRKHHSLVNNRSPPPPPTDDNNNASSSSSTSHLNRAVRVAAAAKQLVEDRRYALEEQIERENRRLAAVAEHKSQMIDLKKQANRERQERMRQQVAETEALRALKRRGFAQHFDATVQLGAARKEHNAHCLGPRERSEFGRRNDENKKL